MLFTRTIFAAFLAASQSGCGGVHTNVAPAADPIDICEAWKQINVRRTDVLSAETAKSVVENNVGREAMGCDYEPPPKVRVAEKKQ